MLLALAFAATASPPDIIPGALCQPSMSTALIVTPHSAAVSTSDSEAAADAATAASDNANIARDSKAIGEDDDNEALVDALLADEDNELRDNSNSDNAVTETEAETEAETESEPSIDNTNNNVDNINVEADIDETETEADDFPDRPRRHINTMRDRERDLDGHDHEREHGHGHGRGRGLAHMPRSDWARDRERRDRSGLFDHELDNEAREARMHGPPFRRRHGDESDHNLHMELEAAMNGPYGHLGAGRGSGYGRFNGGADAYGRPQPGFGLGSPRGPHGHGPHGPSDGAFGRPSAAHGHPYGVDMMMNPRGGDPAMSERYMSSMPPNIGGSGYMPGPGGNDMMYGGNPNGYNDGYGGPGMGAGPMMHNGDSSMMPPSRPSPRHVHMRGFSGLPRDEVLLNNIQAALNRARRAPETVTEAGDEETALSMSDEDAGRGRSFSTLGSNSDGRF